MKLQRVTFLGIRGLSDVALDFTNPSTGLPHDVVVLTGSSASGKTRALEAIVAAKEAIGAYGPTVTGDPWISAESLASKVVLSFHLDEEEQLYAGSADAFQTGEATFFPRRTAREAHEGLSAVLERFEPQGATGKVEYFPATRRLPSFGPFHGLGALEQRLLRPTKDARKYSAIIRFLRDIEETAGASQAFAERLAALSPTCRYERNSSNDGLPRCFSSRRQTRLSPSELSDSEADAVLLAATSVMLGLNRSIILIDRPEIYADSGYLRGFVQALRQLGQGNQFILASSSPDLLSAAEPALILRLGEV